MSERATRDSWHSLHPMPDHHANIQIDRVFSPQEMAQIRHGFIPHVMEEKWFIYCDEDDVVYFHRSWTGYLVFEAHFVEEADGFRIETLLANRDPEQYRVTDDTYDVHAVQGIIDNILLRRYGRG